MPVAFVEKQKAKAIKQAKKLLLGEGILSESQLVSQTPVSNMYSFFECYPVIACFSVPFIGYPLVSFTLEIVAIFYFINYK